jgi:hypothetical protein
MVNQELYAIPVCKHNLEINMGCGYCCYEEIHGKEYKYQFKKDKNPFSTEDHFEKHKKFCYEIYKKECEENGGVHQFMYRAVNHIKLELKGTKHEN